MFTLLVIILGLVIFSWVVGTILQGGATVYALSKYGGNTGKGIILAIILVVAWWIFH